MAAEKQQRVAVVGAGWAGLSAAVKLAETGAQIELFEASPQLGGRARSLSLRSATDSIPQNHQATTALPLDNGQHILIGAYTETLALLHSLGLNEGECFWRGPLDLRDAQDQGLALADLPPPWNALLGMLRCAAWSWADKFKLLRWNLHWQNQNFICPANWSVQDLCQGGLQAAGAGSARRPFAPPLPTRVLTQLITPLCLAALNTAPHEASAQVFLRVLNDALFSRRDASHLLLPRRDLSALLPQAAERRLLQGGARIHLNSRVQDLQSLLDTFDAVVLASSARSALQLLQKLQAQHPDRHDPSLQEWLQSCAALQPRAIATVYATSPDADPASSAPPWPTPQRAMLSLPSTRPEQAQFVFNRSMLFGLEPWGQAAQHAQELAFVVSDAPHDRPAVEDAVRQQAQQHLGLKTLHRVQTIIEKSATFACTPGLQRPHVQPSPQHHPHLWACGDYIQGPYPATLEGAVRSATALSTEMHRAQHHATRTQNTTHS